MNHETNQEKVDYWRLLRLAVYTFTVGAIGAYGFSTAAEIGLFSKWEAVEKILLNPESGMAIGVIAGILYTQYVNRELSSDNSGWAWEERFRVFLYAGIGSVIGLIIIGFILNRYFPKIQSLPIADYIFLIGGPSAGAIIGGYWATLINRDVRGRGASLSPLTDEEFEKLVKEEEAKMDDEGNYLPESEWKNKN